MLWYSMCLRRKSQFFSRKSCAASDLEMRSASLSFSATATAFVTSANEGPLSTASPGMRRLTSPLAILSWRRRAAFCILMAASISSELAASAASRAASAAPASRRVTSRGFAGEAPRAATGASSTCSGVGVRVRGQG